MTTSCPDPTNEPVISDTASLHKRVSTSRLSGMLPPDDGNHTTRRPLVDHSGYSRLWPRPLHHGHEQNPSVSSRLAGACAISSGMGIRLSIGGRRSGLVVGME